MSNNLNSGAYFNIHRLDDRKVCAIQTVSDPKQRRQDSNRTLQLRWECVEEFMLAVRMRPPVVTGDIRDHRELLGRKAAQLTVGDQVIRMLVMRAFVDEVSNVMKDRSKFEPVPLSVSQVMEPLCLVEEPQGERGDVEAVGLRHLAAASQGQHIPAPQIGNVRFGFDTLAVP